MTYKDSISINSTPSSKDSSSTPFHHGTSRFRKNPQANTHKIIIRKVTICINETRTGNKKGIMLNCTNSDINSSKISIHPIFKFQSLEHRPNIQFYQHNEPELQHNQKTEYNKESCLQLVQNQIKLSSKS